MNTEDYDLHLDEWEDVIKECKLPCNYHGQLSAGCKCRGDNPLRSSTFDFGDIVVR